MDQMDQTQVQNQINSQQTADQYGVAKVPYHVHNGTDSPQVSMSDVSNATRIYTSGSAKLTGDVLLAAGTNITLSQSGQTVTVTAPQQTVVSTQSTYTASEALSANDAVAAGYTQTTPITLDAKASGTVTADGSGNATVSFTVGNNSNRIMIVAFASVNTTAITNIKYAGNTFTDIVNSTSPQGHYNGYILAPATGTNNFTFTAGPTSDYYYAIYSYYNASQSGQPEAQNNATGNGTTSISTSVNNFGSAHLGAVVVGVVITTNAPNITNSAGWANENTTTVANHLTAGDTGLVVPPATITVGANFTAASTSFAFLVGINPTTVATYGVVKASSTPGVYNNFRTNAFIGFAASTVAAGATVTVYTSGMVSGFTLTPLSQYYLNDTNGTIGTAAGTLTRKVGIAINASDLLITNIW